MARDLSEKRGEPLTLGDLYGERSYGDRDVLNDGEKIPINANIILRKGNVGSVRYYKDKSFVYFLKDEEFACGYAEYDDGDYYGKRLLIFVYVSSEIFSELLQIRADSPAPMFLDVDIRGLVDEPRVYWPGDFGGTWDLGDDSDCGRGDYRVVTGFSFEREVSFFPDGRDSERRKAERNEGRQALAKLHTTLGNLVAIENGDVDGAVTKLLRLNLLAVSTVAVIGLLILAALLF